MKAHSNKAKTHSQMNELEQRFTLNLMQEFPVEYRSRTNSFIVFQ